MKRWIFVLLYLIPLVAGAQTPVVTIGWDDYPPYQMGPEALQQGIDLDIVQTALKRAGYEARFIKLPWARQLKQLESGALDMAMSASVSPERAKYAAWSNAYRSERATLIALQGNTTPVTSLQQLMGKPLRIGLIRDSAYPGEYEKLLAYPEFRKMLEFTNINQQNLDKLRAGRIDYLIDDPVTIEYLASASSGAKVHMVLDIMKEGSHFMVSKMYLAKNSGFLEQLNAALGAMKKAGETQRIFRAYGVGR